LLRPCNCGSLVTWNFRLDSCNNLDSITLCDCCILILINWLFSVIGILLIKLRWICTRLCLWMNSTSLSSLSSSLSSSSSSSDHLIKTWDTAYCVSTWYFSTYITHFLVQILRKCTATFIFKLRWYKFYLQNPFLGTNSTELYGYIYFKMSFSVLMVNRSLIFGARWGPSPSRKVFHGLPCEA